MRSLDGYGGYWVLAIRICTIMATTLVWQQTAISNFVGFSPTDAEKEE